MLGTDLKVVARWHYDWRTNARENFQNQRKWVQSCAHHFAILKRDGRKVLAQPFTSYIVDVHPYKIFCYLVTGCYKNCQVRRGSAKTVGSATICAHRNAIMP